MVNPILWRHPSFSCRYFAGTDRWYPPQDIPKHTRYVSPRFIVNTGCNYTEQRVIVSPYATLKNTIYSRTLARENTINANDYFFYFRSNPGLVSGAKSIHSFRLIIKLLLLRYFLFILWTNNRDHLLILLLMYSETWFWCPTLVEEIRRTKEQCLICLRIVGQDSMLSLAGGPKTPVEKVLKCSCRSLINISTLKNSRQEN